MTTIDGQRPEPEPRPLPQQRGAAPTGVGGPGRRLGGVPTLFGSGGAKSPLAPGFAAGSGGLALHSSTTGRSLLESRGDLRERVLAAIEGGVEPSEALRGALQEQGFDPDAVRDRVLGQGARLRGAGAAFAEPDLFQAVAAQSERDPASPSGGLGRAENLVDALLLTLPAGTSLDREV